MHEIKHKKEATEISPDGIAAAAAALAATSGYAQKCDNLSKAFWCFFDFLLTDQDQVKRELDEQKERKEKECEEMFSGFSVRTSNALRRAYLPKSLTELTDDDLLEVRMIGPKALAEIRAIIPAPLPEGVKDER